MLEVISQIFNKYSRLIIKITFTVSECAAGEFSCDIERCIPLSERCDNKRDCTDGTDELQCPSPLATTARPGMWIVMYCVEAGVCYLLFWLNRILLRSGEVRLSWVNGYICYLSNFGRVLPWYFGTTSMIFFIWGQSQCAHNARGCWTNSAKRRIAVDIFSALLCENWQNDFVIKTALFSKVVVCRLSVHTP